MAPNIYCCGAGTAADTEQVTGMISSQLELLRLQTGRQTRVVTALTQLKRLLFKYQGHVGAYLVLGGVDVRGPHLHTIWAGGSTDTLPYVSMGSGSLAAMSVLESSYHDKLTEEEAVGLVSRAIRSGIFNDLGSGSNVDICIIRQAAPPPAPGSSSSSAAASATGDVRAATAPVILASSGKAAGKVPTNVGKGVQVQYLRNYETPNEASEYRAKIAPIAAKIIPKGATEVVAELFRKHVVATSSTTASSSAAAEEEEA
jgi:20S proteasome subunit beta 2